MVWVAELSYLAIALMFGTLLAFVSPPFQSPDESNHFYRALDLSRGHVRATRQVGRVGAAVDSGTVAWVSALVADIPFHPENKQTLANLAANVDRPTRSAPPVFVEFPNTALYSPIPYVPQAIALALGRAAGLPLLGALYLARLMNLLVTTLVCYWAVRRLPYGRLPTMLAALSPMFLFEQASLSADGLTFALAFAFCAWVLDLGASGAPLGRAQLAGLSVVGALVCLTKPSSALLPLLVLLLPTSTGARGARHAAIILGVSWAALLLWTLAVSGLYVPHRPGIDPAAQLAYVASHPVRFAVTLWESFQVHWLGYVWSTVGVLGWLDTPLSFSHVEAFYWIVLFSGLVSLPPFAHPTWPARALAGAVIAGSYLLISLIMYLSWTEVGAPIVEGVQGRYFLALTVPWAVVLQWPAIVQRRLHPRLCLVLGGGALLYAVVFLAHALGVMAHRYWLP